MSIVLSLTGQLDVGEGKLSRQDARDWLARAAVWFEGVGDVVLDTRLMRDPDERPVLLVDLHPISPAVELRLAANGRLRVTANTTPAGPGYHRHLCHLLHNWRRTLGSPGSRTTARTRLAFSTPAIVFAWKHTSSAGSRTPAPASRNALVCRRATSFRIRVKC